jgi:UDP-glucose 4-epimerase
MANVREKKGEGGVVSIFCKLLAMGKAITVYGDGRQTRDFVYAGDIADAIIQALPLKGFHTFNVSTGNETSINELIRCFEEAVGHAADVHYTEARTGDILRSVLSNDALKQDTGYRSRYETSRRNQKNVCLVPEPAIRMEIEMNDGGCSRRIASVFLL